MTSSVSFKFSKSTQSKITKDEKTKECEKLKRHFSEDNDQPDNHEDSKHGKKQKVKSLGSTGFKEVEGSNVAKSTEHLVIPALQNTLNLEQMMSLDSKKDRSRPKSPNREDNFKNTKEPSALIGSSFGVAAAELDYESVPVESFGVALLMGLGWKDGTPIGRNAKKVVKPWTSEPRPKGLGLGAAKPVQQPLGKQDKSLKSTEKSGRTERSFKKGVYVRTLNTKNVVYGVVVSVDSDNARVYVKVSVDSEEVLNLSQHAVERVSKEEYEKFMSGSKNIVKETTDATKKKKILKDRPTGATPRSSWLYPDLKVRLVDPEFANSRYYEHKMTICDVVTPKTCNCLTQDGKILENLHYGQLETVVPQLDAVSSAFVRILRGPFKSGLARLVQRDSRNGTAVVQLVVDGEEQDEIFSINFDDICEYVGRVDF